MVTLVDFKLKAKFEIFNSFSKLIFLNLQVAK